MEGSVCFDWFSPFSGHHYCSWADTCEWVGAYNVGQTPYCTCHFTCSLNPSLPPSLPPSLSSPPFTHPPPPPPNCSLSPPSFFPSVPLSPLLFIPHFPIPTLLPSLPFPFLLPFLPPPLTPNLLKTVLTRTQSQCPEKVLLHNLWSLPLYHRSQVSIYMYYLHVHAYMVDCTNTRSSHMQWFMINFSFTLFRAGDIVFGCLCISLVVFLKVHVHVHVCAYTCTCVHTTYNVCAIYLCIVVLAIQLELLNFVCTNASSLLCVS